MFYRFLSKTKNVAVAVAVVVAGCASIPDGGIDEVATVTVEVRGGNAALSPGAEFSVPVGGDAQLYVDAGMERNTRIAGIWVDGGRVCCAADTVVRETWVELTGVKGGIVTIVELARIDTVLPVVELISPEQSYGEPVWTSVSICSFGELEYKLNKTMAFGYIRWADTSPNAKEDRDSLCVVRIPADITKFDHEIGAWSYVSPAGYLSEGRQKFDLAVSPVFGKRIVREQIPVNKPYDIEIQFTDSLGNASDKVSRQVWVHGEAHGCR
jgi:hypothetical protein